jgi:glycyl-tRNA synthetase beta chain
MLKPLLIEVGVEELPALPLLKELPNIEKKWLQILEKYNFKTGFQFFYTPRRLVLWHREFPVKQPDRVEEVWGPPRGIAEKNRKAVEGFARKVGVDPSQLQFRERNGRGEFLYFSRKVEGRAIEELLGEMVEEWLSSLNFGKSMRWGECPYQFIRPVRWIVAMLEDRVIPFSTFCVESGNRTEPHRGIKSPIYLNFVGDYFCQLDKNGVILYPEEREKRIREGIKGVEEREGVEVEIDPALLREVVAITEYPTPLIGRFDEQFLKLPEEVIVTSMKEHQRYFPVYRNGKLTNRFIVVADAWTDNFSKIVAGNERVLRARLKDALFFWEQDLKKGLNPEGLRRVVYMEKLGSLADKVERELKIAHLLGQLLHLPADTMKKVERGLELAKADLLTDMVYEFPELQGVMGYYYALAQGEEPEVAVAIKEQYGDHCSNPVSALLNLSQKLENLMGLFGVGERPKGNRDPYGMRRSANHILKILRDYPELELDLNRVLEELSQLYRREWGIEVDPSEVAQFIWERLYNWYSGINPAIIRSVLAGGEGRIPQLDLKISLLARLAEGDEWEELVSLFKRVANILKGVEWEQLEVDPSLFREEAERELWRRLKEVEGLNSADPDLERQLDRLLDLKPTVARFFDEVMVNVDDPKLRANRQGLVARVLKNFIKVVGDLRHLS